MTIIVIIDCSLLHTTNNKPLKLTYNCTHTNITTTIVKKTIAEIKKIDINNFQICKEPNKILEEIVMEENIIYNLKAVNTSYDEITLDDNSVNIIMNNTEPRSKLFGFFGF